MRKLQRKSEAEELLLARLDHVLHHLKLTTIVRSRHYRKTGLRESYRIFKIFNLLSCWVRRVKLMRKAILDKIELRNLTQIL